MPIIPLYRDFFRFLDGCRGAQDPWERYQEVYVRRQARFFQAYWDCFRGISSDMIAQRVRAIKAEDYGHLRSLIHEQNPERLAREALERCQGEIPLRPEPPVYLFVGFFGPDGMTIDMEGEAAIVMELERFRDFKDLSLLIAHEYGHCLQRSLLPEEEKGEAKTLIQKIQSEGLAVLFSQAVHPEIPIHRHLFLTRERYGWCRENREALLDLAGGDLGSPKLIPVLFGPGDPVEGIPPRVGYFLAREMLLQCGKHHAEEAGGEARRGFFDLLSRLLRKKTPGAERAFPPPGRGAQ